MIETKRLLLRPYRDEDRGAMVAMFGDPVVMRDLGPVKSPEDTDATIARHEGYRPTHGLGFWVVEKDGDAIGHCGLKPGAPDTPIDGEVEIGWIVARPYWRQGYAREAAQAALDWAWANRSESRVVAITAERNAPSRAMMERLGMQHLAEMDFDHPSFPQDPGRRRTVVYAIDRPS